MEGYKHKHKHTLPLQTDFINCGVYVAFYAYQWIVYAGMPNKNKDWNEENLLQLRQFMVHTILKAMKEDDKDDEEDRRKKIISKSRNNNVQDNAEMMERKKWRKKIEKEFVFDEFMYQVDNTPNENRNHAPIEIIDLPWRILTDDDILKVTNFFHTSTTGGGHSSSPYLNLNPTHRQREGRTHIDFNNGTAATLSGNRWLSAHIIGVFLDATMSYDKIQNTTEIPISVLDENFYKRITSQTDNSNVEIYDFSRAESRNRREMDLYKAVNLLGDIISIVYRQSHYLLCIISKSLRKIYVIDPYHDEDPSQNIVASHYAKWYNDEFEKRNQRIPTGDDNALTWSVIVDSNAEFQNMPKQTDSVSCGVFACMTAFKWMKYRSLLSVEDNCNNTDMENLRRFIAIIILEGLEDEKKRLDRPIDLT